MRCADETVYDIERKFGGQDGYPDGYKFEQNKKTCTISINFPPETKATSVDFNLDPTSHAICVALLGKPPVVCGVLYSTITQHQLSFKNGLFQCTFQKTTPEIWPVFVKAESVTGVDPKSDFILSLYNTDTTRLIRSAQSKYIPAVSRFCDICSQSPQEFIRLSPAEIVSIFRMLPVQMLTDQIGLYYVSLLDGFDDVSTQLEVLRYILPGSYEARLQYAILNSPLFGNQGSAREAVDNFRVLAEIEHPQGMWCYARHLWEGCGIEQNQKDAKQWDKKARLIDPTLEPLPRSRTDWIVAAGVGTVSVLAAGLAFAIGRRKK